MGALEKTALLFDCRTPDEFAEDHVPCSENSPVLSNEERKVVGTLHKQDKIKARQLGASLISSHIAVHLQQDLSHRMGKVNVLYCARGGMRSQSLSTVLNLVGIDARIIDGGYKSYRHFVQQTLDSFPETGPALRFHILCGLTGTKKTKTLGELSARGEQVVDLERLAMHRGSVLGAYPQEQQPAQRMFDTELLHALLGMDPGRPVWIEAEAAKIGNLSLPGRLWHHVLTNPSNRVFQLECSVEERVRFLLQEYDYWPLGASGELVDKLAALGRITHRPDLAAAWTGMVHSGAYAALVRSLLEEHYDKRYAKSKVSLLLHPRAEKIANPSDLFQL